MSDVCSVSKHRHNNKLPQVKKVLGPINHSPLGHAACSNKARACCFAPLAPLGCGLLIIGLCVVWYVQILAFAIGNKTVYTPDWDSSSALI